MPAGDLPNALPKPFFGLLDRALSDEIRAQVKRPFWIDTVGQSRLVEIRVKLDDAVLRFVAQRGQTAPSNTHIFLVWMVGTSVVLLTVAIMFLRNQIRPILRLADAADAFGKGRPVPEDFRPRGAREVRQAAQAFIEMRERIMQHVDQRTTMLAGVSHDLRTVLTRFKLELALLGDSAEIDALKKDVNEMQHMLEDYLAFAKGDGGEEARPTSVQQLLQEVTEDVQYIGTPIELEMPRRRQDLVLPLKRQAFKRALTNLVTNAARFGDLVVIRAATDQLWLKIEVDDDGPGIPRTERDNVFRPFYRLDHARNQNEGNSGLGLAIARDIARSHGGDIDLGESALGGLKAAIRVPL
jgi:two-component system, OmpR family, osmolarity sensor histidine kinase EnvZ